MNTVRLICSGNSPGLKVGTSSNKRIRDMKSVILQFAKREISTLLSFIPNRISVKKKGIAGIA